MGDENASHPLGLCADKVALAFQKGSCASVQQARIPHPRFVSADQSLGDVVAQASTASGLLPSQPLDHIADRIGRIMGLVFEVASHILGLTTQIAGQILGFIP